MSFLLISLNIQSIADFRIPAFESVYAEESEEEDEDLEDG